jgi:uncharacterized protein (TIGR00156 family)
MGGVGGVRKCVVTLAVCAGLFGLTAVYAQPQPGSGPPRGGFTGPQQGPQGPRGGQGPHGGFGGYTGPSAGWQAAKVSDVKKLQDDTRVSLKGNILRSVTEKKYIFSDGTGEVVVEIDRKQWRGQLISEKDKVEIYGEVEVKKNGAIEVDVKFIAKTAP